MILSVTLNPSIDVVYLSPSLKIRRVNRVKTLHRNAGGKGINAALALDSLGTEVITMGFIGGVNGRYIEEYLQERKLTTNFVYIDEETRINHVILNKISRFQVQILEEGPWVEQTAMNDFLERYERTLTHSEIVIIGGSLPRNISSDFYKQLIEIAHRNNVQTFLYASGNLMDKAIEAGPTWLMPDLQASDRLAGKKINTLKRKVSIARELIKLGTNAVFYGPEDLDYLVVTREKVWQFNVPSIEVVNIVGAGDTFIAYLVNRLQKDGSLLDAVRYGVSASTVCAQKIEKVIKISDEVDNFLPQIEMREVAL